MGQSKGSLKPVPGCPFMENEAVIVIKTDEVATVVEPGKVKSKILLKDGTVKEVKNSEIKGYLADVFSIKN